MGASVALQDRIRDNQRAILGFLARRAPEQAEELAQEVWFRVARAEPDCATDQDFRAYAFAVARRLLIDHHRRRAARIQLVPLEGGNRPPRDPATADRPDSAAAASQIVDVVESTLADMKPELAEVFRWRTTGDVAFKEIAVRHGCSINTALGRMHQATKKVRAALLHAGLLDGGAR